MNRLMIGVIGVLVACVALADEKLVVLHEYGPIQYTYDASSVVAGDPDTTVTLVQVSSNPALTNNIKREDYKLAFNCKNGTYKVLSDVLTKADGTTSDKSASLSGDYHSIQGMNYPTAVATKVCNYTTL